MWFLFALTAFCRSLGATKSATSKLHVYRKEGMISKYCDKSSLQQDILSHRSRGRFAFKIKRDSILQVHGCSVHQLLHEKVQFCKMGGWTGGE